MKEKLFWNIINFMLIVIIGYQVAEAQTLQRVEPATDWSGIAIAVVAVIVIAACAFGVAWYMRRAHSATDVTTPLSGLIAELHKLTEHHSALIDAIKPAEVVALAEPPTGKLGTPGRFVVEVTGDPKVDLPAINAQYFG